MSAPELPSDLIGLSGLYNTPDPLLRRIRLEDSTGHPITDIDRYFRGKKVVILYAGSEHGTVNLQKFHQNLTNLVLSRLKTLAVIYVSTDTNPGAPRSVLATQPWLRMIFHDNSDFAPMGRESGQEVEMEEVSRGEDFVQGGEIETGMESVRIGVEERPTDYVRPLSRAAVTALMTAYATPSVAIYHLESHKFLTKNVNITAFSPANIQRNYHTWQNGGTPSVRLADVAMAMRWPLIFAVLAIIYNAFIYFGGIEYNVIPQFLDAMSWRSRQLGEL